MVGIASFHLVGDTQHSTTNARMLACGRSPWHQFIKFVNDTQFGRMSLSNTLVKLISLKRISMVVVWLTSTSSSMTYLAG